MTALGVSDDHIAQVGRFLRKHQIVDETRTLIGKLKYYTRISWIKSKAKIFQEATFYIMIFTYLK